MGRGIMKRLLLTFAFCLVSSGAWAQCNGAFPPGTVCGNSTQNAASPTAIGSAGTINPTDPTYGALCDGSTDDHLAFQSAINAAIATNQALTWRGNCRIASTLTVAGALLIRGQGLLSTGILADTNITVFHNTTFGMQVRDMNINFSNAAPCGSAQANSTSIAFQLDFSNFSGAYLENVWINCAYTGIYAFGQSNGQAIGMTMTNINHFGFDFETDGSNHPAEDWGITNSQVLEPDGVSTATEVVRCASCWGLRFENNKMNGNNTGWKYGIHVVATFSDGDLFIVGNSFEGMSNTTGAAIQLERTANTICGATVIITGNEVSGFGGVNIPADGFGNSSGVRCQSFAAVGQWINSVVVGNNAFIVWSDALSVDRVVNLMYNNNSVVFWGGTHRVAVIGSNTNRGVIGPNICVLESDWTTGCTASTNSGTNITSIVPF